MWTGYRMCRTPKESASTSASAVKRLSAGYCPVIIWPLRTTHGDMLIDGCHIASSHLQLNQLITFIM